tara:strand:+ start:67 stop:381 length:315 start_codon:yes stop_codon:yes gene_type:complete
MSEETKLPEVTQDQIDAWKKEHGRVFVTRHPRITVYYRLIGRDDYVKVMEAQMAGRDAEIEAIKLVALNEIDYSVFDTYIGTATVIHDDIMKTAGFVAVQSEEL